MMNENVLAKLKILAESAKYDVSCSSSGTVRSNKPGTLGNTVGGWGICHSFAEDGRCISLLKIMLTNYCIYDCAYCVNRRSNDLPRATFSVSELVELTMEFYRRNYIEGLFLSSGVVRNPDYTMERLVRVAKDLRQVYRFNGYIHLKSIPGASRELVNEAGLYADRLSVNVEIPKEENLKLLAPEKDHSFAEDGRCISLLKIMLTNYCIYDCAYCVNRRSNDLPRATFSVSELVELTMEFYRRNYIEGLFLSSGVVRNPDYTMERLVRVAKDLRQVYRFNGYIHLKSIPGASRELVNEAGLYADRLSVNVEIPKEENLKLLAPEKDHKSVFAPMKYIQQGVLESKEERQKFRHAPRFAPAGQSTQVIVGATSESDKDILFLSSALYGRPTMKRVYYSGYVSVNTYDKRLPALKQPPLVRENRLYQADWLLRFYQFKVDEIVDDSYPDLDLEIDPKLSWALRHPEQFPVDINKADYEMLLRVPGVGVKSAKLIVASRRFSRLGFYELKKIGVVMKKAQYFITCKELPLQMQTVNELSPQRVRSLLLPKPKKKVDERQLLLDFGE